ncbi:PASTA domain [Actinomyces bovis]|uniref:PASTA domain n=1 Tax=Actinomyces bovis TaxID=1658 RepID=A0ABY1VQB6_9ACTO|nr:PASTA domain-containing protein [Actinomyces bovis]SPT53867.1 PASTA domain [Actinomyces bovis]VEG53280.1 PASTA domain [Actinomyces israelii]
MPEKQSTFASRAATAEAQVTVPNVVGMKVDQARSALSAAGLTGPVNLEAAKGGGGVQNEAEWSVLSQSTAAGTKVSAGQELNLKVRNDVAEAQASASASAAAQAAAKEEAAKQQAEQERQAQAQAAKQQAE